MKRGVPQGHFSFHWGNLCRTVPQTPIPLLPVGCGNGMEEMDAGSSKENPQAAPRPEGVPVLLDLSPACRNATLLVCFLNGDFVIITDDSTMITNVKA